MKSISFRYYGGNEVVPVSTNTPSVNYNVTLSEYCDWLTYNINPTSITIFVSENTSFMDRSCCLILSNNGSNSNYIAVSQDGYRNMLVDISSHVIIPYTYYIENKTFDLPIRVYGGNGAFRTDKIIEGKIERVYDNSDYYNDFVFHIDENTDGVFTFIHSDRENYLKYCSENNINVNDNNLIKEVVVKHIDKQTMNGCTIFSYFGKEYMNALPPMITVNEITPTPINIDFSCFFNSDFNMITDYDYDIKVLSDWVKVQYDKENKKIYLKASSKSTISDRRCMMTVRNLNNPKQTFSTFVMQRS